MFYSSVKLTKNIIMEVRIIVAVFSFIAAAESTLNLTSEWRAGSGWVINCTWSLHNDSLQSVRLSDHGRQFLVYRPEIHGLQHDLRYQLPDKLSHVTCQASDPRGVEGNCVVMLEPLQNVMEHMKYTCEVSGERPWFRIEEKTIEVPGLVPPSDAGIELQTIDLTNDRLKLNCTSSGIPAPTLTWSIGDTRVPADFSGKAWNTTTKQWHVWSLITFHIDNYPPICSTEISSDGVTVRGVSAEYNSSVGITGIIINITLGVLSLLALTR